MTIIPDDKNWTWVLEQQCPDCGFDAGSFDPLTSPNAIRSNADQWVQLLADERATVRPRPDVWSASEYGCHVRDVFVLFNERLRLMLEMDDPTYQNWDQDATAISERYDQQQPDTIIPAMQHAADALAARLASVSGDQWQRTGNRSDGARFTVESFARYLVHDPVHHVHDAMQGYEALASAS